MTQYQFNSEYQTSVYANGNDAITICQTDGDGNTNYVMLGSKKRALAVARAIRDVASQCSFSCEEIREEDES